MNFKKELVADIVKYCIDENLLEYTQEEIVDMTICTMDDIYHDDVNSSIEYFEKQIHDIIEEEDERFYGQLECAQNILNRLITLK